jgi:hypothetical protein
VIAQGLTNGNGKVEAKESAETLSAKYVYYDDRAATQEVRES